MYVCMHACMHAHVHVDFCVTGCGSDSGFVDDVVGKAHAIYFASLALFNRHLGILRIPLDTLSF